MAGSQGTVTGSAATLLQYASLGIPCPKQDPGQAMVKAEMKETFGEPGLVHSLSYRMRTFRWNVAVFQVPQM